MTPPPITEAAGLLQSGAMYPRRVGLRPLLDPEAEAHVLAGFKRGAFSIYFGDAPIAHFDLEGRWQRSFFGGRHYLKGLDGITRSVDRVGGASGTTLHRRTLSPGETVELDASVAGLALRLLADLDAGALALMPPPALSAVIESSDLRGILTKIARWDAEAWADHQARYRRAYGDGPPPFLPPDCTNPVIVRATRGGSVAEFADHARGVSALLGARLGQSRDVFLGGSSWVDRPEPEVLGVLSAINDVFPIQPSQGRPRASVLEGMKDAPRLETIHGWVEDFASNPPSPEAWKRYRASYLGRVTLRVDSRSVDEAESLRSTVSKLKDAEIGVGLACFVDAPLGALADLIGSLPLASGDLIALVDAGDSNPSAPPILEAGKARIVAALTSSKRARVVIYNPDKQWN